MLTNFAARTGLRTTLVKRLALPSASSASWNFGSKDTPVGLQAQVQRSFAASPQTTTRRHLSTNPKKTVTTPDMFCRQCEQTRDNYACTTVGVCGKSAETAAIQDTLMELVRNVSQLVLVAKESGATPEDLKDAHIWTLRASFSTLTNVNFSDERIAEYIHEGVAICKALSSKSHTGMQHFFSLAEGKSTEELETLGLEQCSILKRQAEMGNDDAFCLNELATYGMKGACAYAMHCYQLGYLDEDIMMDLHAVNAKLESKEPDVDGLLANALKVGEISARVLALLDKAHAEQLGTPEPTEVCTTAIEGKCILVSGHDMIDLYELLKQTEGKGINVYTHGEMLPAHQYPKLKQFKHLVGNYGTAWQNQKFEFAGFPGAIVVTTNCILEPRKMYRKRIFSMNEVGVDGVQHIGSDRDFTPVIEAALSQKGFPRTIEPPKYHTVGFNHRVVLPLADKVLEAAKTGALSRIFLIGGCDGSQWDRSYFTELAQESPKDSLILTLGCAKNRLIHEEDLMQQKLANGLPRVLDMGQCNDSYSAVVVALELAKALDCTVNDLPLSLAVSHLEQKAAAVLLTLLHLGVKNIRLGPSLPAYLTPNILKILGQEYNLMQVGDPIEDLEAMMEGK